MRTAALSALALTAFAANSVLCRLALGSAAIDAATFSTIRLISGAAMLVVILIARGGHRRPGGSWTAAALLAFYAVPFSFAYVTLSAGTGALLLFGAVQVTMMSAALRSGDRPHFLQWIGLVLALGGLVTLVLPSVTAPSPVGSALMIVAGVAWGMYSLMGRGSSDPLAQTTGNLARAVPLALVVSLLAKPALHLQRDGAWLAVASGALASGVGYVLWYAALRGLTTARAAIIQLSVPVIAAAAGVVVLAEVVTSRLVLSSALVLGGVAIALAGRERVAEEASS